jgi:hypothetical protein
LSHVVPPVGLRDGAASREQGSGASVLFFRKGKVLSCLVSVKGIEANPDKINGIVHIKPS